MSDMMYSRQAFEAAHARLKSAPVQLTDSDLEQLAIVDPELARQGIEHRHKALHPTPPPVPLPAPSARLDVDAVADAVIDVIGKAIAPLSARIDRIPPDGEVSRHSPRGRGVRLVTRQGGMCCATRTTRNTPGTDGSGSTRRQAREGVMTQHVSFAGCRTSAQTVGSFERGVVRRISRPSWGCAPPHGYRPPR